MGGATILRMGYKAMLQAEQSGIFWFVQIVLPLVTFWGKLTLEAN